MIQSAIYSVILMYKSHTNKIITSSYWYLNVVTEKVFGEQGKNNHKVIHVFLFYWSQLLVPHS